LPGAGDKEEWGIRFNGLRDSVWDDEKNSVNRQC